MSGFGKSEGDASNVSKFGGSLRQRAAQTRANLESTHSKRGGGGRRYSDQFKPTTVGSDKIRIIAGDYTFVGSDGEGNLYEEHLQYWPYVEHFHSTKKRSFTCSGGPKHFLKGKRDECLGCDKFYAGGGTGDDGKKTKGPMSKREMFAFTVWHYHKYHKIEQMDDKGNVVKNDKGEPYYDWVQCEGRGCTACKEKKESVDGRLLHWPMGVTHFKTLTDDIDQLIGRSCRSCGERDAVEPVAWLCSNPECQEAIIDFASTELSDEKILDISSKKNKCSTCGYVGFLVELVQCKSCDNPERATIFDVDLEVKRAETSDREDSKATVLMATGWSNPCPPDAKFADKMKPLSLNTIYAPTSVEMQKKMLGEGGESAGNPGFRSFNR